jgi:hypothetical protein
MAPISEGKSIGSDQKNGAKKESFWFREPIIRLGTKEQSNSRTQFASNWSKLVPRKLDLGPSSKVGLRLHIIVHYHSRSTHGRNWIGFVEIQFHSNENIEWHCMQFEFKLDWIEFRFSLIELNSNPKFK